MMSMPSSMPYYDSAEVGDILGGSWSWKRLSSWQPTFWLNCSDHVANKKSSYSGGTKSRTSFFSSHDQGHWDHVDLRGWWASKPSNFFQHDEHVYSWQRQKKRRLTFDGQVMHGKGDEHAAGACASSFVEDHEGQVVQEKALGSDGDSYPVTDLEKYGPGFFGKSGSSGQHKRSQDLRFENGYVEHRVHAYDPRASALDELRRKAAEMKKAAVAGSSTSSAASGTNGKDLLGDVDATETQRAAQRDRELTEKQSAAMLRQGGWLGGGISLTGEDCHLMWYSYQCGWRSGDPSAIDTNVRPLEESASNYLSSLQHNGQDGSSTSGAEGDASNASTDGSAASSKKGRLDIAGEFLKALQERPRAPLQLPKKTPESGADKVPQTDDAMGSVLTTQIGKDKAKDDLAREMRAKYKGEAMPPGGKMSKRTKQLSLQVL
ncbi:unnamed protein product [Amoebophrya sp. A25]|nr:unnamed protein product [Amoebophrya sp. A25]|eukprot:GSA25T00018394001.1